MQEIDRIRECTEQIWKIDYDVFYPSMFANKKGCFKRLEHKYTEYTPN